MSAVNFKEVAKKFYANVLAGDLPAVLGMVSDDVLVTNPMPAHVPFGNTYNGRNGLQKYLTEIFTYLEMTLEVKEYVAENDSVVVFGFEDSLARPTGRRYQMNWVHHLRFTPAGLICGFHEYNPTAIIADAFQPA